MSFRPVICGLACVLGLLGQASVSHADEDATKVSAAIEKERQRELAEGAPPRVFVFGRGSVVQLSYTSSSGTTQGTTKLLREVFGIGGGLRFALAGFDGQARLSGGYGLVQTSLTATQGATAVTADAKSNALEIVADASLRSRFVPGGRVFWGFGPEIGVDIAVGDVTVANTTGSGESTVKNTGDNLYLLRGMLEIGVLAAEREAFEIALRGTLGAEIASATGLDFGGGLIAGYAF